MLTQVISEWSYVISRAMVGDYVSNYEQAIPQLHDHMSFGNLKTFGNLYSKPEQILYKY